MKIEKAIETLKDYKMESAFDATPDFEAALLLGIEALKRIQTQRAIPDFIPLALPSETEE